MTTPEKVPFHVCHDVRVLLSDTGKQVLFDWCATEYPRKNTGAYYNLMTRHGMALRGQSTRFQLYEFMSIFGAACSVLPTGTSEEVLTINNSLTFLTSGQAGIPRQPLVVNMNDTIRVHLTPYGEAVFDRRLQEEFDYLSNYDRSMQLYERAKIRPSQFEFQLYEFMAYFGAYYPSVTTSRHTPITRGQMIHIIQHATVAA